MSYTEWLLVISPDFTICMDKCFTRSGKIVECKIVVIQTQKYIKGQEETAEKLYC